jgi:hypothetical protein
MSLHFRGQELCYIENDSIRHIPLDFNCESSVIFERDDTIRIYNNFTKQIFSIVEDSMVDVLKINTMYYLYNTYLNYIKSNYSLAREDENSLDLKLGNDVLETEIVNSNASLQESIYRDSICAFRFQIASDNVHIFYGEDGYYNINLRERLAYTILLMMSLLVFQIHVVMIVLSRLRLSVYKFIK